MPRRHFKPDFSFFNKIVIGAVGTNAVKRDLARYGLNLIELERGATDAKIWKEVKRKRVRIPDLVCTKTGLRVESRAKTKAALQMSHSREEAERAWDFGMIDQDWIAFPICTSVGESEWTRGQYEEDISYFHQRIATSWEQTGAINYIPVGRFREVRHARGSRKGVVEASEYSIEWAAKFSTRTGPVRYVEDDRVSIENAAGRAYTWSVPEELEILVEAGQLVEENQLFASSVPPVDPGDEELPELTSGGIRDRFLESKERTMRFTGVKLARVRDDLGHAALIRDMCNDPEEDLYVHFEGLVYLASVCGEPVADLFDEHLNSGDDETALEAVISVGEVDDASAAQVLGELLLDEERPFFLRSAAAWSLGKIADDVASENLIQAFSDQSVEIREEALRGLVTLGESARPGLIEGMDSSEGEVAAGCAEALRQHRELSRGEIREIVGSLAGDDPSHWGVWLIGNLPSDVVAPVIREVQDISPEVHYATSVLWSFGRSWISQHWDRNATAKNWYKNP